MSIYQPGCSLQIAAGLAKPASRQHWRGLFMSRSLLNRGRMGEACIANPYTLLGEQSSAFLSFSYVFAQVFVVFSQVCLANLLGKPKKIHRKPWNNLGKIRNTNEIFVTNLGNTLKSVNSNFTPGLSSLGVPGVPVHTQFWGKKPGKNPLYRTNIALKRLRL